MSTIENTIISLKFASMSRYLIISSPKLTTTLDSLFTTHKSSSLFPKEVYSYTYTHRY